MENNFVRFFKLPTKLLFCLKFFLKGGRARVGGAELYCRLEWYVWLWGLSITVVGKLHRDTNSKNVYEGAKPPCPSPPIYIPAS